MNNTQNINPFLNTNLKNHENKKLNSIEIQKKFDSYIKILTDIKTDSEFKELLLESVRKPSFFTQYKSQIELIHSEKFKKKKQMYLQDFQFYNLKPLIDLSLINFRNTNEVTIAQTQYKNIFFIPRECFLAMFPNCDWDPHFFSTCKWITRVIASKVINIRNSHDQRIQKLTELSFGKYNKNTHQMTCIVMIRT